jgi:hypothetical protein
MDADLETTFQRVRALEAFPTWEEFPPGLKDRLRRAADVLGYLGDCQDMFDDWPLTLHVNKFLTSLVFSRGNEEHAFLCGDGNNGKSWLLYALENVMGDYATGVQAGLFSQPTPSSNQCRLDWLELIGRKVFLAGERGVDTHIDAGTFKALRDPTNAIDIRGLYEGVIKFRSAGRMLFPTNDKVTFKGVIDTGVKRSVLAWPHRFEFVEHPTQELQRKSRDIKNVRYVRSIRAGMLHLFTEIDKVWGASWTTGPILPRPMLVVTASAEICTGSLDSVVDDFVSSACE